MADSSEKGMAQQYEGKQKGSRRVLKGESDEQYFHLINA